ncbi:MAG: DUF86 domain-containing protein [Spirochaetaceae bacterium]|jgi:uncharacterized protein YutE (UPF0331/DUF86 family)|nr:DUF86 domain-containing protein [Spirochaetaceae bacterium]
MNNPLISKKIESLIHCLERIEAKKPDKIESLLDDYDIQDIISVNLERSIQISVDIAAIVISEKNLKTSNTMAGSFAALEQGHILSRDLSLKMQKSVGFRNVSVHEYRSIDWEIVYDIIHNHLINFKQFINAIIDSE